MSHPKVRIRRYTRGWFTSCSRCRWTVRRHARNQADTDAIEHHTNHIKGAAR